jgi:RHS repeat-associated protein
VSNESMKKTSEKQSVTCHYDGLGKRRIKAVGDETHYWRWDAGYSVVAEYKDQTPDWDVGALQRFFVPFGHTALAEATPGAGDSVANGTYTYLAHDHLGTSRKGYNQSQTEVHSNEHLPFGQRFSTTGTVPYHEWTGKPWDADTQMYYFPYRYYSPMMNRWTAADPLGLVDGPNLYGYVGGNPIMHIDPEGGLLIAVAATTFLVGSAVSGIIALIHNGVLVWQQNNSREKVIAIEKEMLDKYGCDYSTMSQHQKWQKPLIAETVGEQGPAGWFVNDVLPFLMSLFN